MGSAPPAAEGAVARPRALPSAAEGAAVAEGGGCSRPRPGGWWPGHDGYTFRCACWATVGRRPPSSAAPCAMPRDAPPLCKIAEHYLLTTASPERPAMAGRTTRHWLARHASRKVPTGEPGLRSCPTQLPKRCPKVVEKLPREPVIGPTSGRSGCCGPNLGGSGKKPNSWSTWTKFRRASREKARPARIACARARPRASTRGRAGCKAPGPGHMGAARSTQRMRPACVNSFQQAPESAPQAAGATRGAHLDGFGSVTGPPFGPVPSVQVCKTNHRRTSCRACVLGHGRSTRERILERFRP